MRKMRKYGIITIASTPLSALVVYALVASLLGESALEAESGSTVLGTGLLMAPIITGAALIIYDIKKRPSDKDARALMLRFYAWGGVLCLMAGLFSLMQSIESSDPNIGYGLLMVTGTILISAYFVSKAS